MIAIFTFFGEREPGVAVFDLGVSIAGWVQLKVSGKAGTEITLRYADQLNTHKSEELVKLLQT